MALLIFVDEYFCCCCRCHSFLFFFFPSIFQFLNPSPPNLPQPLHLRKTREMVINRYVYALICSPDISPTNFPSGCTPFYSLIKRSCWRTLPTPTSTLFTPHPSPFLLWPPRYSILDICMVYVCTYVRVIKWNLIKFDRIITRFVEKKGPVNNVR